jgi:hexosaminidase
MRFLVIPFLSLSLLVSAQHNLPGLMPYPAELTIQAGNYRLRPDFTTVCQGDAKDDILIASVNRIFQGLNRKTGLFFKQKFIGTNEPSAGSGLLVRVQKKTDLYRGVDESYTLSITEKGITIESPNTIGAIRGLETLLQLLQKDTSGYYFPGLTIRDKPRYNWRGLMIDVSRHFIPLDVLKRNLDAMASVKMNVLHLHLTDDEGFRVESRVFPLLHQKGSDGMYYSLEQVRELIGYARLRGIMIVPEFDLPGHSRSWFAGYPQLASAPGPYKPGPRFDVSLDAGGNINLAAIMSAPSPTLDPTREEVYTFLDRFFGEMATLFPAPYLHIGADENNGVAWKNNPAIVSYMQKNQIKTVQDLQAYFVKRVYGIVKKHKKNMIGWEEIYTPGLAADVTVQKWIPEGGFMKPHGKAEEIAARGNPVLISTGFYTDLFMPAYIHYNNPNLPADDHPNVWGGEAAQWTEVADAGNIELRIWPRAGAIAERLWSPANLKTSQEDLYDRLFALSHQLDEQGLQHLASYERGLRRLASNGEYEELKTLTDVLAPVRGYKNLFGRISHPASLANNLSPLCEPGDIISPDPETKRNFRKQVALFLDKKDPVAEQYIRNFLTRWGANHEKLESKGLYRSRYANLAAHSENLRLLSQAGLDAIEKIKSGGVFSAGEQARLDALFTQARKASGNTELDIVPEIESLVRQKIISDPKQYPLF